MTTLPANPRRYSVWSALFLAPLFSGELARDVARNWRGIGLRLLLLVLAITWLVVLIKGQIALNRGVRDELPKFADKIPPVTIDNGVVSSPVEQPYELTDEETGKRMFILDTTGEITSMPDENRPMILLTHDKLFTWDERQHKLQEFSLKEVKHFYIDKNVVLHWANTGKNWFLPVGFIVLMICSLIWRLFMTLIYALIGMGMSSMFNARLSFDALMRLAALASVPMLLLDTVFWLLPVNTSCWWSLLGFALVVIYLGVFIKANEQPAMLPPQYGGGYAPFPPFPPGVAPQPGYPYPAGAPAPQAPYPPPPAPPAQYPPPQYPPPQYPPPAPPQPQ
jgi:hypothetical protein